jgi:hypothetical protein
MAEVFIAAAPGEETQARGLAEALQALGFDVASGVPAEADLAKTAEDAKCVAVLWSPAAAAAPWVTALAVMAQERKKLVSTEYRSGTTPELFKSAPKADLAIRDRNVFKERFQELVTELEKFTTAKRKEEALSDALIKARAAILNTPMTPGRRRAHTLGWFAAGVVALFVLGYGTGRLINMIRSGDFLVATTQANASPAEPRRAAEARPTAARAVVASTTPSPLAITVEQLQNESWQQAARRITEANAVTIKRRAGEGDALAQTLSCLGHMAGSPGFLPSPTAAREQCDAASEQHQPAGLYYSWILRRTAPHAGIDEATARGRLAEAARLNWIPAQIDYAQALGAEHSAQSQAEAGRLFLAAAETGDPRGQYFYARWLRDSPAGPRDPSAAAPYLERAAQRGQVDALHMLATLNRDGIGVPRNEGRAKALYEQAARQNYPASMFNLADMLRSGTEAERARAVVLYQQLSCMRDERQIQPMALARLRALRQSATCP